MRTCEHIRALNERESTVSLNEVIPIKIPPTPGCDCAGPGGLPQPPHPF
jgi:hypothetical protein